MAQKIKVQGGILEYKNADPASSLDFTINGELNIKDELNNFSTGNIYSAGDLNIDAAGEILINGVPWTPSGTGTVTSVSATGDTNILVTGSPITTSGTLSFSLSNTTVTAGTYGSSAKIPVITVDSKGRITASSEVSIPAISAPNSQIMFGTGSSVSSSPSLTYSDTTNTLEISGTGTPSVSSSTGYPILISGDTYITFLTAGQNRLSILQTGEITLNSVGGIDGQVLTSRGTGQPPEWQTPTNSGGTVTSVSGTGTVSGLTLSGTVTTSGNLTLGGTLTLTSSQVTTALGYTPYNATNPNGYTSNTGTVTSVSASGGTTGLSLTGGPITDSGTLTLSGTLSIANGGTGATNPAAALTNILPTQTGNSGKVLTTDGASVSWATASGSGGLGVDQTWQSVSRSSGVTYYNTTGKPISIAIGNNGGGSFNSVMYISIDGGSYFPFGGGVQGNGGAYVWGGTVIVPAGSSYAVSASSITSWYELR